MNSSQLINQTSGKVEYYTPSEIVEAVRRVLGFIDLDPFSSAAANDLIGAQHYFTANEDGLKQDWFGRFFMNHPFGREMNPRCVKKAESEFAIGHTVQGCAITFACTSEAWFKPLLLRPQCFLTPRTNYLLPDGSTLRGVTKGSVVTYYGRNVQKFVREFSALGVVKVLA